VQKRQPAYRELMGRIFNRLIRLFGVRGLRDTQCGFKLLQGDLGRRLAEELTIEGFAYDVELIWLARRHGAAVAEVGVVWINSEDSRVSPIRSSLSMLRDILLIRYRHRRDPRVRRSGARA
jgi:dolichyl-phosphate beta-glucosyltransferase